MTPRLARLALVMFLTLSGALAFNMLTLQESARRTATAPAAPPLAQMTNTESVNAQHGHQTHAPSQKKAPVSLTGPTGAKYKTVLAIQEHLTKQGYVPGPQDGTIGLMTRAAIMAYEHDHGYPLAGQATRELRQRLAANTRKSARKPSVKTGWPATPEARRVIETVQVSLQRLGYKIRVADGVVGSESQRAIIKFETDQNFAKTGRISGRLIAKLVKLADQGRLASRQ